MLFIQDCLLNALLITRIHWKWQWLLAAIFLGDEQSALSTLATDFFFFFLSREIAQECLRAERWLLSGPGLCRRRWLFRSRSSPASLCGLWRVTWGYIQARMGGGPASQQRPLPAPARLPPPRRSSRPDREIPQRLQLCCWARHQVSQRRVAQHLIHTWLDGDLQMRYYFVCGPLRGSASRVISEPAQPPEEQCHHSCCEPSARDWETTAEFPALPESL